MKQQDRYHAKVNITGEGNDIGVEGTYNTADSANALDFNVDLAHVNLSTIEAYTFGQATDLRGTLSGKLKVTGKSSDPNLNGTLKFSDTRFRVTYVNSYYDLKNEEIVFENSRITFPDFKLRDTTGNAAVITGWLQREPQQPISFDLEIETKDFLAINSSREDTGQFRGRIQLDSHTEINGNADFPKVRSTIKIGEGSSMMMTGRKKK
jgi:autotransporter translocation and assembly factor TamB